jgi:hypothetical protein
MLQSLEEPLPSMGDVVPARSVGERTGKSVSSEEDPLQSMETKGKAMGRVTKQ